MQKYRFVGTAAMIHDRRDGELTRLGQRIELSEAEAEVVVRGGAALITEEDYDSCGFNAAEESAYAFPGSQLNAPEEFKAKLRAARTIFTERHYALTGVTSNV
jgi:hypothetical protein